tara:strand:- start:209 stop:451 length:243 start_codon:yes stop_codon:yes gene_type:complete
MTSIDDRATVDEIIAANGIDERKDHGGGDGYTHIIEYQNQFDGRTAWKLCRGEGNFIYAMATGSFVEPKLIWSKHARMEP